MARSTVLKVGISLLIAATALPLGAQPAGQEDPRRNPTPEAPPMAGAALRDSLSARIDHSPVFRDLFTGFVLYDPEADSVLYASNADKYFTPASNTKIFTLYTALMLLGDSLNVGRYVVAGDTTVLWGAANPLLFHPDLPHDSTVYDSLRNLPGQLFFSDFNFDDERFGPGWSWRDFQYAYQAERSPLPLYGNTVHFQRAASGTGFEVLPATFEKTLTYDATLDNRRPRIEREEGGNAYHYNSAALMGREFEEAKPFRVSAHLTARLLAAELDRPVGLLDPPFARLPRVHTLAIPTPDTLYRRLMQDSDNFVAEQLLLMVSDKLFGVQQSDLAIEYATETLFAEAPDELVWADGSGLSRYNLFTPRTVVYALDRIREALPPERLFNLFPAGGVSGTIADWYGAGEGPPYVYAKTGTLSNKHCLSGYLLTRSGRTLLFSFMHNNFIDGTGAIKEEMERVLAFLREAA